MALSLLVRLGDHFYVGQTKVVVEDIQSASQFKLKVIGEFTDTVHQITAAKMTEIMPDVRVSVGLRGDTTHAKVAIEAPRHIKILRSIHVDGVKDHKISSGSTPPRTGDEVGV